jgi:hypothetical protein
MRLSALTIASARTMNFDGRLSSWVRKLTMYTLATAGAKIAKKPGQSKGVGPFKNRSARL